MFRVLMVGGKWNESLLHAKSNSDTCELLFGSLSADEDIAVVNYTSDACLDKILRFLSLKRTMVRWQKLTSEALGLIWNFLAKR